VNALGQGVVLRSAPVNGPAIGSVPENAILQVLEHQSPGGVEWLRVRTAAGQEGWVYGQATRPEDPARLPAGPVPTVTPKPNG
jgi:hypothetical protein